MAEKHLLFVTRPTGYELVERDGDPPVPGTDVELEDGGGRFFVSKVAPSPLPEDERLCAFLQER
ncbi:MAG TPA: hypothetical protein VE693_08080 [Gaiellaceae bacterium]|jgi:hypothetical protein|nr:hypothetical protein [Gaiellaceae bacterium]